MLEVLHQMSTLDAHLKAKFFQRGGEKINNCVDHLCAGAGVTPGVGQLYSHLTMYIVNCI